MVASWRGLEIGKTSNKYEQRVLEGEVKFRQSKPGPT